MSFPSPPCLFNDGQLDAPSLARGTQGSVPSTMVKTLLWCVSKLPLCFSPFLITPTHPLFLPPITMTTFPTPNLIKCIILHVRRPNLMVSLALMSESGLTYWCMQHHFWRSHVDLRPHGMREMLLHMWDT